jgi:hypothetical protein
LVPKINAVQPILINARFSAEIIALSRSTVYRPQEIIGDVDQNLNSQQLQKSKLLSTTLYVILNDLGALYRHCQTIYNVLVKSKLRQALAPFS